MYVCGKKKEEKKAVESCCDAQILLKHTHGITSHCLRVFMCGGSAERGGGILSLSHWNFHLEIKNHSARITPL